MSWLYSGQERYRLFHSWTLMLFPIPRDSQLFPINHSLISPERKGVGLKKRAPVVPSRLQGTYVNFFPPPSLD